jgi:pimeloyl-ACP methyl ester carboxylesterase
MEDLAMATSRAKNSTNVRFMKFLVDAADLVSPSLASELALRAFLTPRRPPRPERERALLATATPLPISAGGVPLAAWSWGEPTAPVVALVHGWAGRGTQLGAFVPALVARGLRVVTWDAPAHGDSPGRTTTLASMATVLREVAERIGPLEAVIAHSFGGAATTIALARGLAARRAVYVAPLFTIGATVDRFASTLGLSPVARAGFAAGLAHANLADAGELEGARLAPALRTPLYVIHDRDDREVPYAEGVATARTWPGARLLTTGGLGHQRVLADPEVVAAAADFAAGHGASPLLVLDEATRLERELANPDLRWPTA